MSEIWAEVWTRPGHPQFGRVIADAPTIVGTFQDGINSVGHGQWQIPANYDRLDEILLIDQVTPANSVSSTVRYFHEDDPTTPFFEWLPDQTIPSLSKNDLNANVSGLGFKSVMDYARVEAYDWDGTGDWAASFPDWIYGGRNLLGNPGFEESTVTPTAYELLIYGTAGTYTLSDGTDTTSAIAFNALAGTIQTELETDITAITDVIVADAGVGPITKLITFVTPPFGVALTVDGSGLTPDGDGRTAEIVLIQDGGRRPDPWGFARALVVGADVPLASYDVFEVSDAQAHTGIYSLAIDATPSTATANRRPGTQQVVSVVPGGIYQASVWIYKTNAADVFDLRIVTIGEQVLANTGPLALTLNTWTELALPDVVVPDGVTELIFRVSNANPGPHNPSLFYVDDGLFTEGLAATTLGEILRDLYEDATVDHVGDGRLVWEDEANPGTAYLTLDFDDVNDSNGNAWADPALTAKLWMRMTYRQVLDHFARTFGYEWRVVPDDVQAGTWFLQVFNPATMGTDTSTTPGPAVLGGASDVRRSLRTFTPGGTDFMVEGLQRLTSRVANTDLVTALGWQEASRLDNNLPATDATFAAATEDATLALPYGTTYTYMLVGPASTPMVDYLIGDLVVVRDPPFVNDLGRLIDVEAVVTANKVTWEVNFVPDELSVSP